MSTYYIKQIGPNDVRALKGNYRKIGNMIHDLCFGYNAERIVALDGLYGKTDLSPVFHLSQKALQRTECSTSCRELLKDSIRQLNETCEILGVGIESLQIQRVIKKLEEIDRQLWLWEHN